MANPTEKSGEIDDFFAAVLGLDRREVIRADRCMSCNESATSFRDALSAKEYTISGLCQACQDGVFGE